MQPCQPFHFPTQNVILMYEKGILVNDFISCNNYCFDDGIIFYAGKE